MSTHIHGRYNVSFDPDLVARIDAVAGRRGRSAFLARAAEDALGASGALSRPVDPVRPIGQSPTPQARTTERAAVQRGVKFDPAKFNRAASLR